jgi:hypothetical protein
MLSPTSVCIAWCDSHKSRGESREQRGEQSRKQSKKQSRKQSREQSRKQSRHCDACKCERRKLVNVRDTL